MSARTDCVFAAASLALAKKDHAMAMPVDELKAMLSAAFPEADIRIEDLAGDGDHYKATIRSDLFVGKSRVAQHQMVYAALKGKMGGELHALALDTGPLDAQLPGSGLKSRP